MYTFAVVVLLGLALFKVVDLFEDLLPALTRYHTILTLVLALAGTVGMDYSMFSAFHVDLRSSWMGAWVTGLVIAGTTSAWRAAFHWLGSSEGEEPELRHTAEHHPRIAA